MVEETSIRESDIQPFDMHDSGDAPKHKAEVKSEYPALSVAVLTRTNEQIKRSEETLNFHDAGKSFFERKFGEQTAEHIKELEKDTLDRMEIPMSSRRGTEILLEGETEPRRPIMDISLNENDAAAVGEELKRRRAGMIGGMRLLEERLTDDGLDKSTLEQQYYELKEVLVRLGVHARSYGEKIEGALGPRGEVADLYIGPDDLARYDKLDALLMELRKRFTNYDVEQSSRPGLAMRVNRLASLTFPTGVELIHRSRSETLPKILRQNQLATRATVLHGTQRRTQLHGAFLHVTPPGSSGEEYGDVMFGIPIDTIFKYSPRLHLESSYNGNSFWDEGKQYSTQEGLGRFTINNPTGEESTPLAFRLALANMHEQIQQGVRPINLEKGGYDNLGFAASGDAETAGKYAYPLNEIRIYSEDPKSIERELMKVPHANEIYPRVHSTILRDEDGNPRPYGNRFVETSNFTLSNEPITVYAPMLHEDVSFTEDTLLGNQSRESQLDITPENVSPDAAAQFAGKFIDAGYDMRDVLNSAYKALNQDPSAANCESILRTYTDRRGLFEQEGIGIESSVSGLNVDALIGILQSVANSAGDGVPVEGIVCGSGLTDEEKRTLLYAIANKIQFLNPDEFYERADFLERSGYRLSPEQLRLKEEYEERKRVEYELRVLARKSGLLDDEL